MERQGRATDAVGILHRRYVRGDARREAALSVERVNASVAAEVYRLRTQAGLTQGELAARVGTTQSVISRIEDADYEGHSLSLLQRIATALDQRLNVSFHAARPSPQPKLTARRRRMPRALVRG